MDYLKAFLIGGLICALVQILLDRTKLMPGRIMVLLVCGGAVLGALQIYQPLSGIRWGWRQCAVDRFWESSVEWCPGSGGQGRIDRNFSRRI